MLLVATAEDAARLQPLLRQVISTYKVSSDLIQIPRGYVQRKS
jgi:hypothetical protein